FSLPTEKSPWNHHPIRGNKYLFVSFVPFVVKKKLNHEKHEIRNGHSTRVPEQRPVDTGAVVALDNDAGEIREQCVEADDKIRPRRVPRKKRTENCHGGPVAGFTAASFDQVPAEIGAAVGGEFGFGKAAVEP